MEVKYDISTLPEWEKRYFFRMILKGTMEYFKDPDVQRRFKEWQEEKRLKAEAEKAAAASEVAT